MLTEIAALLKKHRRLSLGELASALGSTPEAVEPMMELLVEKGRVRILSSGCSRGSCKGCSCAVRENSLIYELA
jgi:predicted ArsR family transcriptional regulator